MLEMVLEPNMAYLVTEDEAVAILIGKYAANTVSKKTQIVSWE